MELDQRASLARRQLALLGGAGMAALMASQAKADTPFTNFAFPAALPTGLGTTPNSQTAPQREGVTVNVKDFGAVGDGSHDDTANIQAACNWVATGNRGIVFFPKGTYKITSAVTVSDSTMESLILTGVGKASILQGFSCNDFLFSYS